jgi:hypothetical protein
VTFDEALQGPYEAILADGISVVSQAAPGGIDVPLVIEFFRIQGAVFEGPQEGGFFRACHGIIPERAG